MVGLYFLEIWTFASFNWFLFRLFLSYNFVVVDWVSLDPYWQLLTFPCMNTVFYCTLNSCLTVQGFLLALQQHWNNSVMEAFSTDLETNKYIYGWEIQQKNCIGDINYIRIGFWTYSMVLWFLPFSELYL